MSIRAVSEGILQTHVTWAEFEQRLTGALKTSARFGPGKSALDIGEGNGFASRCGLIECDWQGEDAARLPKRVILKMGSLLPLLALSDMMPEDKNIFKDATPESWQQIEKGIKDMHNIECDTYAFLAGLGGEHDVVPRVYYAVPFDDENVAGGQICMEYVEDSTMMAFNGNSSITQMKQVARALGKIQAASTRHEIVSESLRTKDAFGEFKKNTPKERYLKIFAPLKCIEASLTEPVEALEGLLEEYYSANVASSAHKQLGITPVLVNGDMRTENVLVDKSSGDLRALIDWQCSHLGIGVEDLLRISFFAQTTEARRATADELVEELYASFVEHLEGAPAPYSLETLQDLYTLLFPHCALFFAAGLAVLMPAHMLQPGEDSEEKRRGYEIVVDKARGVLEDIVTYHARNKSNKLVVNWQYSEAA